MAHDPSLPSLTLSTYDMLTKELLSKHKDSEDVMIGTMDKLKDANTKCIVIISNDDEDNPSKKIMFKITLCPFKINVKGCIRGRYDRVKRRQYYRTIRHFYTRIQVANCAIIL